MRKIEIIVNEDAEIVSVNDFFTFSVKYHNLSSSANTIHESEKLIVSWSTTGIWLIDDNELYIKESNSWRDVTKDLSFFLDWQNPDSTHSPISLKMLFDAIVDSLKHDCWRTPLGAYQEHSIRITEITQHYNKCTLQEKVVRVINKGLKRDSISHFNQNLNPTSNNRMKKKLESVDRLNALKASSGVPNIKQEAAIFKREQENKTTEKMDNSIELLCRKQWIEMTQDEKKLISTFCVGMKEPDIQRFWDCSHYYQRVAIALNK